MSGPIPASSPVRPGRLAWAVAVSAAIVVSAPGIGEVRAWLRSVLSLHFDPVVNAALALAVLGVLAATLARIREHRVARYALLLAALAIAVADAAANATGTAESNAVERFHFIEYGLIAWLFYRAVEPRHPTAADLSTILLPLLAGLLVGTADEALQWYVPGRVGEVRDILIDGVAVTAGLLFSLGLRPPPAFGWRLGRASVRRLALTAAIVVVALGGFVRVVHLATLVTDPAIGTFASRYPPDRLMALSADRATRWRAVPPPDAPPLYSREDHYRTEGLWHVQARNEAWDRGDVFAAWRENLILEKYFAPVLDAAHRWPPEQRADAERRTRGLEARPFTSRAERMPFYVWPKPLFWGGLGAVVAGLAGWALFPGAL